MEPIVENKRYLLVESDAGYIDPAMNKQRIEEAENIFEMAREGHKIVEPFIVTVILQKAGVKNRNGRVYPKHILVREDKKYQVAIQKSNAIGEANHPADTVINVSRVSHNIIRTWWEKDTLMGEMEIIMSPGYVNQGIISCEGDNIANLLRRGILIGVSSRGVGSLRQEGGLNVVQEDFEIICWDVVTQPSTPDADIYKNAEEARPFVESVIHENVELLDKLKNFLKS